MVAQTGAAFLLKISNGAVPAAFATVAGLRTTQISVAGQAVVVTNLGSGGWRTLLNGGGARSIAVAATVPLDGTLICPPFWSSTGLPFSRNASRLVTKIFS